MCASTTDLIQAIAAVCGVIITLIGFVFVYKQIKQVNFSIRSNTHSAIATRSFECSKLLFDNIDLYTYFYENIDLDKANAHYAKGILFSEIIMDHFQFVFLEKNNMDKEIFKKWKLYIKGLYNTSPILKLYLSNYRLNYNSDMVKFLETP